MKSEVCGEYHSRMGKVGAVITRNTGSDGHVWFSYTGAWGAGSVDAATMRADVAYWLAHKRGVRVVLAFSEVSS